METFLETQYDYIDFPVSLVSFSGYVPVNNPMFVKIPSKTRRGSLSDGVTIYTCHSSFEEKGYCKSFEVYFVVTDEYENQYSGKLCTYIKERLIFRMYRRVTREQPNREYEWEFGFNGHCSEENFDKIEKVKRFLLEYVENFKI